MALEKIKHHPDYKDSEQVINFLLKELEGLLGSPDVLIEGQKPQPYAEMFLDAFQANITYPAQVARLLVRLRSVHSQYADEEFVTAAAILGKADDGLTSSDHKIYTMPLVFIRDHVYSCQTLINKFGFCSFVGISEIAAMDKKAFEGFEQTLTKNKGLQENVKACLQLNKDPNTNLNQLRRFFQLPTLLPKDILYPGTDSVENLSPEDFYTPQQDDIYLGLQLLHENASFKGSWNFERNGILYCLLPTVFTVTFRDNEPDFTEQFVAMGKTLCSLLKDQSCGDKVRPLIAGMLLVDNNHCINFFLSPNHKKGTVDVFLLDPSAENKQGTKNQKELFYSRVFLHLLSGLYKENQILRHSCLVSQQLQERDCVFLSLQNLEDVSQRPGIFFIDDHENLRFNASKLTVNGNASQGCDQNNDCYYASSLKSDTHRVREEWATRFRDKAEVTIYELNGEPTLQKLVIDSFKQNPYSYVRNIQEFYKEYFQQKLRDALYIAISNLSIGNYMEKCASAFSDSLQVPTLESFRESSIHLRAPVLLGNTTFTNRNLTLAQIEKEMGRPLEDLVCDFVTDALNVECLEAIATHFLVFKANYEWPADAETHERIYEDFLNQKLSAFFALPGAKPRKEVLADLKSRFDKQAKEDLLNNFKGLDAILANISQSKSLDELLLWLDNPHVLIQAPHNGKLIASLLKDLLEKATLRQINILVRDALNLTFDNLSQKRSLRDFIEFGPNQWRAAVLSAEALRVVRKIVPEDKLLAKVDVFYNARVERLMCDAVDDLVHTEKFNLARFHKVNNKSTPRILALFDSAVLKLKKGEKSNYDEQYFQKFMSKFHEKLNVPCRLFEDVSADFTELFEFVNFLRTKLGSESQSVNCFMDQLRQHGEHIDLLRKKSTFKLDDFVSKFSGSRALAIEEFKMMLIGLKLTFNKGSQAFQDLMRELVLSDEFKRFNKDGKSKLQLKEIIEKTLGNVAEAGQKDHKDPEESSGCVIF